MLLSLRVSDELGPGLNFALEDLSIPGTRRDGIGVRFDSGGLFSEFAKRFPYLYQVDLTGQPDHADHPSAVWDIPDKTEEILDNKNSQGIYVVCSKLPIRSEKLTAISLEVMDRINDLVQDMRLSEEFRLRLEKYMGKFDPSSPFARMYRSWYKDHAGRRSDWFRNDLTWRVELGRPLKGRMVLDFGCGTGSSSVVLVERGAKVVGVETEPVSLSVAVQRARDLGLEERCLFVQIPYLECGSEVSLPFKDGSFDMCTLIGVLEHMKPDEQTVCAAEIRRVLRPGGDLFIFDTPNRAYLFDDHTTHLWFVRWMPKFLARKYAIARNRLGEQQDFERYGGCGISRSRIDRLFPPAAWSLSYEKSVEDIVPEFGILPNELNFIPQSLRERASSFFTDAARAFLNAVKFVGRRPSYWTSSHALCLTKLAGEGTAD
jgi:SAM-dependent methyltransferase